MPSKVLFVLFEDSKVHVTELVPAVPCLLSSPKVRGSLCGCCHVRGKLDVTSLVPALLCPSILFALLEEGYLLQSLSHYASAVVWESVILLVPALLFLPIRLPYLRKVK